MRPFIFLTIALLFLGCKKVVKTANPNKTVSIPLKKEKVSLKNNYYNLEILSNGPIQNEEDNGYYSIQVPLKEKVFINCTFNPKNNSFNLGGTLNVFFKALKQRLPIVDFKNPKVGIFAKKFPYYIIEPEYLLKKEKQMKRLQILSVLVGGRVFICSNHNPKYEDPFLRVAESLVLSWEENQGLGYKKPQFYLVLKTFLENKESGFLVHQSFSNKKLWTNIQYGFVFSNKNHEFGTFDFFLKESEEKENGLIREQDTLFAVNDVLITQLKLFKDPNPRSPQYYVNGFFERKRQNHILKIPTLNKKPAYPLGFIESLKKIEQYKSKSSYFNYEPNYRLKDFDKKTVFKDKSNPNRLYELSEADSKVKVSYELTKNGQIKSFKAEKEKKIVYIMETILRHGNYDLKNKNDKDKANHPLTFNKK